MPNLTDVLNDEFEDKPTVENLAMGVCVALYGTNTLMTNTLIQFDMSTTATGELQWLAPNGTWGQMAIHGDGMNITFGGNDRLKLWEDALSLEATNSALEWGGARVMVSDPISGGSAVVNTMVLTAAQFGAITPVANTQYLIVG